ncbi:MAG: amino acid permease [Caldilineales bacterium]|nr:amino acid permease [Caldilineales bacterium]MDW8318808.1 amino acid permease [Anaerolineae bacterium]
MLYDEQSKATVLRRPYKYQPPRSWRTWLLGRPLATADAEHETIGKKVGLAVFASDALSSNAYATQEILVVLAAAGVATFGLAIPISIAIVALLAIVTLSYEQIIHAYPNGGGAYIVSRDNLGELAAQVAGAALLTDYILTASVSISSGVAQIVSAFPVLFPYRVPLAVGLLSLVMLANLRGVRESGTAFAIPTYFFLFMMALTLGLGLWRHITGSLGDVVNPPAMEVHELQAISLFLILHAFANGTTALTGVEAISNGITAFKEPRSRNAGITLIWMAVILASIFLSITFLAVQIGAVPAETETVISQLARTVYGNQGILYLGVIVATTVILILATNTAFNGFPRLSALLAIDGFLPRQLAFRGSRLVYSWGIVALTLVASLLIVVFRASVTGLIPLYAIGVFLSFTLSQVGMARRWYRTGHLKPGEVIHQPASTLHYDPRWRLKMMANGFGAVCTAIVMGIFAWTKFSEGAWIVLVLIPLLVLMLRRIHRHYTELAARLSLENYDAPPRAHRHRVIMPLSGVHRGTLAALRYARTLSSDVTAVHVCIDPEVAERVRQKWELWGEGVRLVILDSPYRLLLEPLMDYIAEVAAARQPNETITVVVPEFVTRHAWENLLHTQTAWTLRFAFRTMPGVVITTVPYQLDDRTEPAAA